jgi:hypothetical protein
MHHPRRDTKPDRKLASQLAKKFFPENIEQTNALPASRTNSTFKDRGKGRSARS